MSVINDRELGRCRHALAQRVVAGTLETAVDCEFSFAHRIDGSWMIAASTLPWRVGTTV